MAAITENVHFRTSHEIKQRITEAADLLGQSITDFIESAAAERAQQVLAQQNLVLTNDERDRFLEAIALPPVPSEALKQGAARAQRAVQTGVLGE
jgi:uncharacterized protein (DUF1778 family)